MLRRQNISHKRQHKSDSTPIVERVNVLHGIPTPWMGSSTGFHLNIVFCRGSLLECAVQSATAHVWGLGTNVGATSDNVPFAI